MSRFSPTGSRPSIPYLTIVLFSILTVVSHSMILLCIHADGSVGLKSAEVEVVGSQPEPEPAELSLVDQLTHCYDIPLTLGHEILGEIHHLVTSNFLLFLFSLFALGFVASEFVFSPNKDFFSFFRSGSNFESPPYSLQVVTSTVFLI